MSAKNTGEVFDLITTKDQHDELKKIARIVTDAESAVWRECFKNDPVAGIDFLDRQNEKNKTGRWPKLPNYNPTKGDNLSLERVVRTKCDGLHSHITSCCVNHVRKLYNKKGNRIEFLRGNKALPGTNKLRIRFRGTVARIVPDSRTDVEWFRLSILFYPRGERMILPIKLKGASLWTCKWLRELASTGQKTSDGCISLVRKRRKWVWQISFSRSRYEGERQTVVEPIVGRYMLVYAPVRQDAFIKCRIIDEGTSRRGAPWEFPIEDADLLSRKHRIDKVRRTMGYSHRQSPSNARREHGTHKRLEPSYQLNQAYNNAVTTWIEQRSAYIVKTAIRYRCTELRVENLVERDSEELRMGSFPYHQLLNRIKQKALTAGIAFKKLPSISDVMNTLDADVSISDVSNVDTAEDQNKKKVRKKQVVVNS